MSTSSQDKIVYHLQSVNKRRRSQRKQMNVDIKHKISNKTWHIL